LPTVAAGHRLSAFERSCAAPPSKKCSALCRARHKRHEALSRLADDGVPVHEPQLLAGHASITTTQRYMNARATSLAESMRKARERRATRGEVRDFEMVQGVEEGVEESP
jgi:integrase